MRRRRCKHDPVSLKREADQPRPWRSSSEGSARNFRQRRTAMASEEGLLMYPLAHLGIGSLIARPFSSKLPFRWILLGTLLPDLIDKPIYFVLGLIEYFNTGGWVPGKRGFAHTGLFLLLLVAVAVFKRSASWAACAIGTATHLLLDTVSKMFGAHHSASANLTVLLWPLLGWKFPTMAYGLHGTWALLFEIIGAIFLALQLVVARLRPKTI